MVPIYIPLSALPLIRIMIFICGREGTREAVGFLYLQYGTQGELLWTSDRCLQEFCGLTAMVHMRTHNGIWLGATHLEELWLQ